MRAHLDAILADGEWHDRDELVAAALDRVPPGAASRRAVKANERRRARYRETHAVTRGPQGGRALDAARAGARLIVGDAINGAVTRGVYERRRHQGVTQVRAVAR